MKRNMLPHTAFHLFSLFSNNCWTTEMLFIAEIQALRRCSVKQLESSPDQWKHQLWWPVGWGSMSWNLGSLAMYNTWSLEINDGFSNGKIALNCPWQVKEFCCDEFENLVYIDVVCSTWKEQRRIQGLCICSCLPWIRNKLKRNQKFFYIDNNEVQQFNLCCAMQWGQQSTVLNGSQQQQEEKESFHLLGLLSG